MKTMMTHINDTTKENILGKKLHTLFLRSAHYDSSVSATAHQKVALRYHFFADCCEELLSGFRDQYIVFNDSEAEVDNAYVFTYNEDAVNVKCYVGRYFANEDHIHCDAIKCKLCDEMDVDLMERKLDALIIFDRIEEFSITYDSFKDKE